MNIDPETAVVAIVAVLSLALNVAAFLRSARKDKVAELEAKLDRTNAALKDCENKHAASEARFDGLRDENIHLMRLVLGLDPASGQHVGAGT